MANPKQPRNLIFNLSLDAATAALGDRVRGPPPLSRPNQRKRKPTPYFTTSAADRTGKILRPA